MTRNTAREIAAHLAYEWNFTDLPVGEFLDRRLAPECFAELAPECGLYADAPNAKQAQYIRRLVAGVADHAAELDDYIARYAQGWRFERIPLMASAVMRVAMYEILYNTEYAGQTAHHAATDSGFGRDTAGVDPVAGVFVETDSSDQGNDMGHQGFIEYLFTGYRIFTFVSYRTTCYR